MSNPVPELLALLGKPVVFINWPKGSKGTRKKWGHLTVAHMTPEYMAKLTDGNIGVALGDTSGGLCAIDIDDDELIDPFNKLNPQLAGTLQTRGNRGRVYWVRFTDDYPHKTISFQTATCKNAGEFRAGSNSQSIIWGIHPTSGQPYQILVRIPAMLVQFSSLRWPNEILNPPTLQRDGSHLCDSVSLSLRNSVSLPLCLSVKSIEEAVEISLTDKEHQNNAALFRLARGMLALNATKPAQMKAFALWYEKQTARGVLRPGQTRDEYFIEFMNACRKAKTPLGSSPVEMAWSLAETEPMPSEAAHFETREAKLLVALCFQMHRLSKGQSWFLATRTAGRLTGKTHPTIARWLSALIHLGIIEIVENHTSQKAPRYRYCAKSIPASPQEA